MPPTSSSAPSVTTFVSFSPGSGRFCAPSSPRYSRPWQSGQPSNQLFNGRLLIGPVALPDPRRDELAVAGNRDGEITVEGVKAEDVIPGLKGPKPSFAHDSNHGFRKRWDTTDTNESDITEASFCQ